MNEVDAYAFSIRPELLAAVRELLTPRETLTEFIETALTLAIKRRQSSHDLISRALALSENARATGRYATTDDVLKDLEAIARKHSI